MNINISCNELEHIIQDTFYNVDRFHEEDISDGREYWSSVYIHSAHDMRTVSPQEISVRVDYTAHVNSEFMDGDKDELLHWCRRDDDYIVSGTEEVTMVFSVYKNGSYEPAEIWAFNECFLC